MTTITMAEIKRAYNPGKGRHYFDRETMKFFNSVLPRYGYSGTGGIFFMESIQCDINRDCELLPRQYKVKHLVGEGKINTIEALNKNMSKEQATIFAKRCARRGVREVRKGHAEWRLNY